MMMVCCFLQTSTYERSKKNVFLFFRFQFSCLLYCFFKKMAKFRYEYRIYCTYVHTSIYVVYVFVYNFLCFQKKKNIVSTQYEYNIRRFTFNSVGLGVFRLFYFFFFLFLLFLIHTFVKIHVVLCFLCSAKQTSSQCMDV